MPLWMPRLETQLYRVFAWVAARQLSTFASVESVYVRRSVACDEVVFGHSDIDFHLLVRPYASLEHEAHELLALASRYARLKRLIFFIGDCNVSTRAELAHWYRERPYTWYRDRAWRKIYGEDWKRPEGKLTNDKERDSLLWWFFWAWERLPGFFRRGDIRICCNLFLDMVNVYGLYTGALKAPTSRRDVLRYWQTVGVLSKELDALVRGFSSGFRGNYQRLLPWLYRESLKLGDMLATQAPHTLEGERCVAEMSCRTPFNFAARTYVLVDSLEKEEVSRMLEVMRKKADLFVTTEKILKLYLYHRNPWEYHCLRASNPRLPLTPPPEDALRRSVQYALQRETPRSAGFSIGRRVNRGATIGFQYAQCQLYVEHGRIATGAEELKTLYQHHYGVWPYSEAPSREEYFLRDYPVLCRTIDALTQKTHPS